jgi:hypothetical protein
MWQRLARYALSPNSTSSGGAWPQWSILRICPVRVSRRTSRFFRSVCGGIVVHKIGATKKAFASTEELFRGWTAISSPTEAYWFVQDFVADVSKQVINADKKRSGGEVIQAAAGAKRPKLVPQVFAVDSGVDDDCVIIDTPVRVKSPRYGAVPIAAPSPLCDESGGSQTLSLEDLRKARLARFDTAKLP